MATTKKPATKKVTTKKAAPRKKAASKSTAAQMKSFKLSSDNPTFRTFKITRQTVYWVILVSFIIFVQLWILKLQIEVTNLLDVQQSALLEDVE